MSAKVISLTVETDGLTPEQLEVATTFAGKNAGICYMKDSYFDSDVSDAVKAAKRFISTSDTGHHSIADHVNIEVLFEECSKMLAIVLNSLQQYSTSEKSGRYTKMSGNSETERDLYNKWKKLFWGRILEIEPNIDDTDILKKMVKKGYDCMVENRELQPDGPQLPKEAFDYFDELVNEDETLPSHKMAQENARYVLSVFTKSTSFGYTTSIRQWNYIYDWCNRYCEGYLVDEDGDVVYASNNNKASYFESELYWDLSDLAEFIESTMYVANLRDYKNRCFNVLCDLSGDENHPMQDYSIGEDDNIDMGYCISYYGSFVQIAQAQRHRTLKYFIKFDPTADRQYFVPMMIRNTELEEEWLKDLKTVEEFVPQATRVGIIETGFVGDFVLKCTERLCGRAQWETMHQTYQSAKAFLSQKNLSPAYENYMYILRDHDDEPCTKCKLLGACREACRYGADGAFTRQI